MAGRFTFGRQDSILPSDVYDDTLAPGSALEGASVTTSQGDANALRSQVKRILGQTNWFDDIPIVNSKQRDLLDLNTDLDAFEERKILCPVQVLTDVTVPAAVAATGVLTLTGNVSNLDQVEIDGKTHTFQTVLTNVDGNVLIGASASDSIDNLIAAIVLGAGSGTLYAALTTLHPTVSAAAGAGDTMDATAKKAGTVANTFSTTDPTDGGAVMSWGAATLTGGAGDVVVLVAASSETPTVTAAIGTGLGTVVAILGGDVGAHDLVEITGSNPLNPKNLVRIRNAVTKDVISSTNDAEVFGLLQAETGVIQDDAFNDTDKQVQISFVEIDPTTDDLVPIDGADIGGEVIEYLYMNRIFLKDIPEDCVFPLIDFADNAAMVDVTLDRALDNQGTTPATQSTNIDWDIGASRELFWRDNAAADVFGIVEGSAGGTTIVKVTSDVDTFDVDAVVVDFANGMSINTGGTRPIRIGVNDGVIETTAGDLRLNAAAEMFFDDVNQTGSTWAQTDGIKLSEDTAEWDAFEAEFGEASFLKALVEAKLTAKFNKTSATVTSNIPADTDLTGSNLSVALHDMSGGDFVRDHDVFIDGDIMVGGVDLNADFDYYPGTSLAAGNIRVEFSLSATGQPDVITVISRA